MSQFDTALSADTGHDASRDLPWRIARDAATQAYARGVERVPFAAAAGRVLARDVCAAAPLPGCDVAAMDGYAVAGAQPWRVVGRVFAGHAAWPEPLAPGAAVEIMTGAPVPVGASAVVPYERSCRDGAQVVASPQERTHIRRAGEDARTGDVLVTAGRRVTAAVLGAAAQAGAVELSVYRRPRVRVVVTGDEVIRSGVPRPGQVRDALGPVVTAIVERAGGVVTDTLHLPDDGEALLDAVRYADDVDVMAVTGSSSVGAADHLHEVIDRLDARWLVDGVRCRPGHPQVLAQSCDGPWIVGLPGNPFAGLVAAMTLLEPLVTALSGGTRRPSLRLPVRGDVRAHPGGVRLVPVRLEGNVAVVIAGARPASIRAAADADALAVIDSDWTAKSAAELLPLP